MQAGQEVDVEIALDTAPRTVELPDDLSTETLDPAALPAGWNAVPAPAALQALGTSWLTSARSAALVVPSAVITRASTWKTGRPHDVGRRSCSSGRSTVHRGPSSDCPKQL